jgi:hypothetical protein
MATVYLARDLKHDRQVAIKVLRPDLSVVLGGERFFQIHCVYGILKPYLEVEERNIDYRGIGWIQTIKGWIQPA